MVCLMTGCPESPDVDVILADKFNINFGANGGCDTVTMLSDYESWYISQIRIEKAEMKFNESCQCEIANVVDEENYVYDLQKDGLNAGDDRVSELLDSSSFKNDWLNVYIPDDNPKKVVVSSDGMTDGYDRNIRVDLCVDDHVEERKCMLLIRQKAVTR